MPAVTVEGLDKPINLPDGLSQDEMTEAVESHPAYVAYKNSQTAGGRWKNLGTDTMRGLGSAVSHMPFVNEIGEKVTGGRIENSPEIQQWQHDNPVLDTVSDIGGKTTAAIPATLGAEALGGGALAYGGLYSLYNMAGTLAKKGKDYSPGDAVSDVGSAIIGTGLGKALQKVISPTYFRPKVEPKAPAPVVPEAVPPATPTNITTPAPTGVTPRSGLTPAEQSSLGNGSGFNPSRATQTPAQTRQQIIEAMAKGKSAAQIQAETEAAQTAARATAEAQAQHAKEIAAVKSQNEASSIAANAKSGLSKYLGRGVGAGAGLVAGHALGLGPISELVAAGIGRQLEGPIANTASKYLGPIYRNKFLQNHPDLIPLLRSLGQGTAEKGRETGVTGMADSIMRTLGH